MFIAFAQLHDLSGNFMPEDAGLREVDSSPDYMQVRMAKTAGSDFNEHLARLGVGGTNLIYFQSLLNITKNCGLHCLGNRHILLLC